MFTEFQVKCLVCLQKLSAIKDFNINHRYNMLNKTKYEKFTLVFIFITIPYQLHFLKHHRTSAVQLQWIKHNSSPSAKLKLKQTIHTIKKNLKRTNCHTHLSIKYVKLMHCMLV